MREGVITTEIYTTDPDLYNLKQYNEPNNYYPYYMKTFVDKMEVIQQTSNHFENYFYPSKNTFKNLEEFNEVNSPLSNCKSDNKVKDLNKQCKELNNYYEYVENLNILKVNNKIVKENKNIKKINDTSLDIKTETLSLDTEESCSSNKYFLDLSTNKIQSINNMDDLLLQSEVKYEHGHMLYNQEYQEQYVKEETDTFSVSLTELMPHNYQNLQSNYINSFIMPGTDQYTNYNSNQPEQMYYQETEKQMSPEQEISFSQDIQQTSPIHNTTIYDQPITQISPVQNPQIKEEIYLNNISHTSPPSNLNIQHIDLQPIQEHTSPISNGSGSLQNSPPQQKQQLQSFELLKNNIQQKCVKKEKIHECKICNKNFTTLGLLKRHLSSAVHKNTLLAANNVMAAPNIIPKQQNINGITEAGKRKRSSTEVMSDESLNESHYNDDKARLNAGVLPFKRNYNPTVQPTITSDENDFIKFQQSNGIINNTESINNRFQNLQPFQYYNKDINNGWSYPPYTTQNPLLQSSLNNNQFPINTNFYQDPIQNGIYNFNNYNLPYNGYSEYSPQNYSDNSISPPMNNIPVTTDNRIYQENLRNDQTNTDNGLTILSNKLLVPPLPNYSQILSYSQDNIFNTSVTNSTIEQSNSNQLITQPIIETTNPSYYASTLSTDLNIDGKINSISPTTSIISDCTQTQSKIGKNIKNKNVKKIKQTPSLKKRKVSQNDESQKVTCLECNRDFAKICYLTQHNKIFHSGDVPFKCSKCGKRFHTAAHLEFHAAKHQTVDKPFKCDLCTKQFHHKTDLRRHRESHTGYNVHVCNLCQKGFSRRDHLKQHYDTHFGIKVRGNKSKKNVDPGTIASYSETINLVCSKEY